MKVFLILLIIISIRVFGQAPDESVPTEPVVNESEEIPPNIEEPVDNNPEANEAYANPSEADTAESYIPPETNIPLQETRDGEGSEWTQ